MATGKHGSKGAEKAEIISSLVGAVEGSREFLEWRERNKSAYLSSLFVMVKDVARLNGSTVNDSPDAQNEWLLSYYDREDDTFTTFSSLGGQRASREQAFKKDKILPALKTGTVSIEVSAGVEAAEEVRLKKYKGEEASSVIAILQPLTGEEIFDQSLGSADKNPGRPIPVWNITYITASYNIINVKVDAETGKVLTDRMSGVMDFMQKDK